jgi:hypothetical protein
MQIAGFMAAHCYQSLFRREGQAGCQPLPFPFIFRQIRNSQMDKAYMVVVYPRQTPHSAAPGWTLDHALQVAGVDLQAAQAIKGAFNGGDIAGDRSIFVKYLVNSRLGLPIVLLARKRLGSFTNASQLIILVSVIAPRPG